MSLAQVCGGGLALRERVEALLNVHEREEAVLQSNSAMAATAEYAEVLVDV